jgi:hypothetical protein
MSNCSFLFVPHPNPALLDLLGEFQVHLPLQFRNAGADESCKRGSIPKRVTIALANFRSLSKANKVPGLARFHAIFTAALARHNAILGREVIRPMVH